MMKIKKNVVKNYMVLLLLLLFVLAGAATASAQQGVSSGTTTRATLSSGASQAEGNSDFLSMSADGRFFAFRSDASNLVEGDTNSVDDIFVRDRHSLLTSRVSLSSNGAQGNDDSSYVAMSGDGRYVAFSSSASNLVSDDTNDRRDVFLHHLETGETTRVSVKSNGDEFIDRNSLDVAISFDGRYIAFALEGQQLAGGGGSVNTEIFVHDRVLGQTGRVSLSSNGVVANRDAYAPSISADGRYVTFSSRATSLVDGLTGFFSRVYVRDRQLNETVLASLAINGTPAATSSQRSVISADGSRIAFTSDEASLVAGDTNEKIDVFVRDFATGTTKRVSINPDGSQMNYKIDGFTLSGDGETVAFASEEADMLTGQTNIFFYNLVDDMTTRRVIGSGEVDDPVGGLTLSADGILAGFSSQLSSLVASDTNEASDIFIYDQTLAQNELISTGSTGAEANNWTTREADVSADGRFVVFASQADNLVLNDSNDDGHNDIFIRDRQTFLTARVSLHSDGTQANGNSGRPAVSDDGNVIVFFSDANNLVDNDTNNARDIFVHNRSTQQTTRVSVASDGTEGNAWSEHPDISGNGRFVVFRSEADNLIANDTNGVRNIFLHDLQTGETRNVSVAADGSPANGGCRFPSISADGNIIAYASDADNLVAQDNNSEGDVFMYDRVESATILISVAPDGTQADRSSDYPNVSADGKFVLFHSFADNIGSGLSTSSNLFVYERESAEMLPVEVPTVASELENVVGYGSIPAISGDGRFIAFNSSADNLVPNDTNQRADGFVYDRLFDEIVRISTRSDGTQVNEHVGSPVISADGRVIIFPSEASNLVYTDTNGARDIFVHERDVLAAPTAVQLTSNHVLPYQSLTLPFVTVLLLTGFARVRRTRSMA